MDFINPNIQLYCEAFSAKEPVLLEIVSRETHLKVPSPRMLSGHLQGRLLSMLSQLIKPKNILEIGTYTGYSALCLAEGLPEDGKLITIDPNEETNFFARKYIQKSNYSKQIEIITGDAREVIPRLNNRFNLVFIDADKKNYGIYFDLVIDITEPGGLIIADNVLWSGKVIGEKKDADTLAIHAFNEKVNADPRVTAVMLPIRDGLTLLRKIA